MLIVWFWMLFSRIYTANHLDGRENRGRESMFDIFNFAYLDPGTGSLIIQSVIGGIAGIAVFGRNAIRNIASKLRPAKNSNSNTANSESEAE